jgi:hypothetical protein
MKALDIIKGHPFWAAAAGLLLCSLAAAAVVCVAVFYYDDTPPRAKLVKASPLILPAGGGVIEFGVTPEEDHFRISKVYLEVKRGPKVPPDAARFTRSQGGFHLSLPVPGNSSPGGNAIAGSASVYAEDWAGNATHLGDVNYMVKGSRTLSAPTAELESGLREELRRVASWDVMTGNLECEVFLTGPADTSIQETLFLENLTLARTAKAGGIELIDLRDGAPAGAIKAESQRLQPRCMTADGHLLAVSGERYGAESGYLFTRAGAPAGQLKSLPVWGDCEWLAVKDKKVINLDELYSNAGYYGAAESDRPLEREALSGDGKTLVRLFHYGTHPGPNWVRVWDTATRRLVSSFSYSSGGWQYEHDFSVSWDGRWVELGNTIVDVATGSVMGRVDGAPGGIGSIFTVRVIKNGTAREVVDPGLWAMIKGLKVSRQGILVYGGKPEAGERYEVYDLRSAKRLSVIEPGSPKPNAVDLSPDGSRLYVYQKMGRLVELRINS